MATIRIPEGVWTALRAHLFGAPGEHFAFMRARWTLSRGEPVFLVRDATLIRDSEVVWGKEGMQIATGEVLRAVNAAVKSADSLIEVHNHGGRTPRFSITDREYLPEFVEYILSSLPGRPYAATVWGNERVYGEYFSSEGRTGTIESVTVVGTRLRQVVSLDDHQYDVSPVFDRQIAWFSRDGQQELAGLRIAVVGCGGTGSHTIQNLVYLGCRDFVLVDDDVVESSNMNRLVAAAAADIGRAKAILARRLIRSVAPDARVLVFQKKLRAPEVFDALKGVDVLFGCVDNDGARLVLNELALAYAIPFFDLATGIEVEGNRVAEVGGRVATVLPGGPCLHCMQQIDLREAGHFLSSPEEQQVNVDLGYVVGANVAAPAVVSLNALVSAAAANEFAALVSGIRDPIPHSSYDLLGSGRSVKGQWMTPLLTKRQPHCIECAMAGLGDEAHIEARYAEPIATKGTR